MKLRNSRRSGGMPSFSATSLSRLSSPGRATPSAADLSPKGRGGVRGRSAANQQQSQKHHPAILLFARAELAAEVGHWLEHLGSERRYSQKTLEAYGRDVRQLLAFLNGHFGTPL